MTGTVITFYSYKGGVGRSFTLANVAVLLARWGYRVLAIDWDLEAPGLHYYFAGVMPTEPKGGVVDLASAFLAGAARPRAHGVRLDVDGELTLLAAGRQDGGYRTRVQSIDWDDLYQRGFAAFLETCRAEWTRDHDFVLIDSRTGIADTAGICTAHLPDRLVMVFTANDQSVTNAVDVVRSADRARDALPYDRPAHLVLPLLSRLDGRVEYQRAERWKERCVEIVAPLWRNWLSKNVPEELMLRHLSVPYVSYWSFGEELAVLAEQSPSADQISFSLETVASVIAQRFDRTDLLADNRDAYVAAARTHRQRFDLDVLVSCPWSASHVATELIEGLHALDVRADRSLSGDPERLDRPVLAQHLCLVVDGEVTRWQISEAERFLRRSLEADGRQLFCVLTRGTDPARLPSFLRNLRPLELRTMRPDHVAHRLHELISDAPPADTDHTTLRDAATALRRVPAQVPYPLRLDLLVQTVHAMATALDNGDLALIGDLTVDLELLSQTRTNGDHPVPTHPLHTEIQTLLTRLDRRTNGKVT
ncbi:tyrosine-protein kinase family protein [Actinophytocola xinjiangensis]|nr:AAA family ATPase [Actinophytocola xinjiangensis]